MIKHFRNSLFLLLLVYNNLRAVHSQYKSLLHPTNNLLDPEYQRGQKIDSTLAAQLKKVDLNHLYKQLISKALKTGNDARNQQNKSKEQVHIVHSISARDFQHNINKRQDDGRDIPMERRKVKKLKADPIERPATSTDSNRDDAYYVTNIESTNINKPDPGRMNRKVVSNLGIARKFDTAGVDSLELIGSSEDAKVELVNKYTSYNQLEEGTNKDVNDEYGNKYNEMELNTNGTEGSKENGSNSKDNGRTSEESKGKENESTITKNNGKADKYANESDENNAKNMEVIKNMEVTKNNTSSETGSSESFKKLFPTYPTPSGSFFARKKDLLRNIVLKRCHNQYSFLCLKIDLMKIIDKLNTTDQFTLLPGVQIVRHTNASSSPVEIPTSVILSILRNSTSPTDSLRLDEVLLEKLRSYLSQLSVSIRLLDTAQMLDLETESHPTALAESAGRTFFSGSWKDTLSNFMGRGKKQNYGHAALWSAGTLAALAFASLAALSGKALITSILALLLAAMCAFKGHHHGHGYGNYGYGKTSHYEIITKPAHFHDHEHLHSTNLAAAASPYASYARQLVTDPMLPTLAFDPEEAYAPYGPHEE